MSTVHAARDLWRSARHDRLGWVTVGLGALLCAVAELGGDVAIGDAHRTSQHLLYLGQWALMCGTALRLGVGTPALQWSAVVVAGPTSRTSWAVGRLGGLATLQAAQVGVLALLGGVSSLRWGLPLADLAVFYGLLWLEALLWAELAALGRCWTRPWVAAGAAAVVGILGHLQDEYVQALATWDLELLARVVWMVLPGLDLVGGVGWAADPDPTGVALAATHGVGWAVALGAAIVGSLRLRDLD